MNERQSFTQAERRKRFEETHDVATAMIHAQRAARDAKTVRLRELREAKEQEALRLRLGVEPKHRNDQCE